MALLLHCFGMCALDTTELELITTGEGGTQVKVGTTGQMEPDLTALDLKARVRTTNEISPYICWKSKFLRSTVISSLRSQ